MIDYQAVKPSTSSSDNQPAVTLHDDRAERKKFETKKTPKLGSDSFEADISGVLTAQSQKLLIACTLGINKIFLLGISFSSSQMGDGLVDSKRGPSRPGSRGRVWSMRSPEVSPYEVLRKGWTLNRSK